MTALRQVNIGNRNPVLKVNDDGSSLLTVNEVLNEYPNSFIDRFRYWAETTPDQLFIARRNKNNREQWLSLSYGEAWSRVQKIAISLLEKNLSQDRPIAILSENSIEHALLALAAMSIGVPFAPISPQYSLVSTDYSKLKYVLDLITPGLVFVDNGKAYEPAINACVYDDCEILLCENTVEGKRITEFSELEKVDLNPDNLQALNTFMSKVGPDSIAKFLFSSGSTGMPKAVINTQKMICSNLQMIIQTLPFLAEPKPILVDWLPWNHTFGGNHNFGIAIYNGGSYYIDDGKPTPTGAAETAKNLKEIAPTAYYNVPKGFEELVKALKKDEELCKNFFSRVSMLFYAGAGLSQPVWDALEELALKTCGERILIVTGLGCTETAPSALFTTGDGGFAGWLGLPMPGVETKLVPAGGKIELRVRGDNVTPGYWREPSLTAKAFDEEGYFCTGDAVKFTDENDLSRGLVFDGRISEDFKLNTGTWVSAGPLRAKFLNHFGDLVKDVVIVGRDRAFVSALVFPDIEECRKIELEILNNADDAQVCSNNSVVDNFKQLLTSFSEMATGSATRVKCLQLLVDPPSLDKHEITDKGSLNANAVQDNRADVIEGIYTNEGKEKVISI